MHNKISTSIYYVVGQDLRVLLNTQKKTLSHESIQLQGALFLSRALTFNFKHIFDVNKY